jgi:C4-dicarboxylate-specific signal transduction histidine kinase
LEALRLRGACTFIHCGDVEDALVLDQLAGMDAHLVWGNCDWNQGTLGRYASDIGIAVHGDAGELTVDDQRISFTHRHEPQLKRARARLVTDVRSSTPVAIEAHALQQVLVNLVQNAAQAMLQTLDPDADGGGSTITLTVAPAPGGIATAITVRDEGPGVPVADRARVFDPFFTTKAAGTGTGLGLAVCKHLVTTAGGSIEVGVPPDGRGAEFRLVIPNVS